jgi:thioredoxin 1
MEQLASESGGKYKIGKLNVDENPQTAARYQISSIPTMLLFKNGEFLDRLIGAQPKEVIVAHLMRAI